jgi:branched-chain amino acid transport system permease protein
MPVAELLNGGIRLSGGYALMALRLNLIFGVMRDQFLPIATSLRSRRFPPYRSPSDFRLPFWGAVAVLPIGCVVALRLRHCRVRGRSVPSLRKGFDSQLGSHSAVGCRASANHNSWVCNGL